VDALLWPGSGTLQKKKAAMFALIHVSLKESGRLRGYSGVSNHLTNGISQGETKEVAILPNTAVKFAKTRSRTTREGIKTMQEHDEC
jgi:hypothetical protein